MGAVCYFYFQVGFLSINFCLHHLIASQSSMNGVFNIMRRLQNSWPGVACIVLWYVLRTAKDVAANIPDQGSSFSR